jgi:biofilm PGA synthesis protein PgaA
MDQFGGRVEMEWTPDDYWTLYGSGEVFSEGAPPRALKDGVTANAVRAGGLYRFHEGRKIALGWGVMDFSDGNLRNEISPRIEQRVLTRPRFTLDALGDLYFSTNSLDDAAYFNPKSFFTPTFALSASHLTWRRYHNSFEQTIEGSVGGALQSGFEGRATGAIAYKHNWNIGLRCSLSYGASLASRVYDGDRQREWAGFFELNLRF